MTAEDPLPLRSGRTTLRRFADGDLRAFQAYRQDPDVARYQSWSPMDDERARRFIAAVATEPIFVPGAWSQIAVSDAAKGELIGDVGVCVDAAAKNAELGVTLARPAQGRGLATEACRGAIRLIFAHTPVARVKGFADIRNEPSLRLLERLGMTYLETIETVEEGETFVEKVYALERADAPSP